MKKLPIIRHIRYFYLSYQLNKFLDYCEKHDMVILKLRKIGFFPQQSDLDFLQRVWEGKA